MDYGCESISMEIVFYGNIHLGTTLFQSDFSSTSSTAFWGTIFLCFQNSSAEKHVKARYLFSPSLSMPIVTLDRQSQFYFTDELHSMW